MNPNTEAVYRAIKGHADDRGFARTTLADLTADTALSTSTVKRALAQLVAEGRIQKRSKQGGSGGLLLRISEQVTNRSRTGQRTGQNELIHNAFEYSGSGPTAPEPNQNIPIYEQVRMPPALDAETRKRGAEFFRNLRLGIKNDPESTK